MSELRYKSGEVPAAGDRVQAPPTTKTGAPRIGRVDRVDRYHNKAEVDWEKETRKPRTPKSSFLQVDVLEKIDERQIVQDASDLCHQIASIFGRRYSLGDVCRLRTGRVVGLGDLALAAEIEQLVGSRDIDRLIDAVHPEARLSLMYWNQSAQMYSVELVWPDGDGWDSTGGHHAVRGEHADPGTAIAAACRKAREGQEP